MRELKIIEEIRRRAGRPGKPVVAGIGDDCAVLELDRTRYLLWAADMLVDGTHFRTGKVPYKKIGRKAVAVNISDIAAMGGVPRYITVTLGVPPAMSAAAIRGIYDGIFAICREYGIKLIGGDTNRSKTLVVDVSIMGTVEKKRLARRGGARPGDLVLITGPVRDGKKEHTDFTPRLEDARHLTGRYRISSMIDVSDGIAVDLGRICRESRAGCRLYAGALPLSKGLSLRDALYYGESFELLFTMAPTEVRKLFRDLGRSGKTPRYFIIGEITRKQRGMFLIGEEGRPEALKMEGYSHL